MLYLVRFYIGWTNTKISKKLNVNKNTVTLWSNRYSIGNLNEEKKSGRKRKTTKEEYLHLINIVKNKGEITNNKFIINDIALELKEINM